MKVLPNYLRGLLNSGPPISKMISYHKNWLEKEGNTKVFLFSRRQRGALNKGVQYPTRCTLYCWSLSVTHLGTLLFSFWATCIYQCTQIFSCFNNFDCLRRWKWQTWMWMSRRVHQPQGPGSMLMIATLKRRSACLLLAVPLSLCNISHQH